MLKDLKHPNGLYNPELFGKKDIFVFGSNEGGVHGAGAAADAINFYGAIMGRGNGLEGNSYAIPTKDFNIETLPLTVINYYVSQFIRFADRTPHLNFYVTELGCGLAGYKVEDIAPMFWYAKDLPNVQLPVRFYEVLTSMGG